MAAVYKIGNQAIINAMNIKYQQEYFDSLATSNFLFTAVNRFLPPFILALFVDKPQMQIILYLGQRVFIDAVILGTIIPCLRCYWNGRKIKEGQEEVDKLLEKERRIFNQRLSERDEKMEEHRIAGGIRLTVTERKS